MIFISLGSQKFQFNRLLKALDELIANGVVTEPVYAQVGHSDYVPQNYDYEQFLSSGKFRETITNCDVLITHGGTGAIISGVKASKRVIAVPRLARYGEHVDDHQVEIIKQFDALEIIIPCYEADDLGEVYRSSKNKVLKEYVSDTETILDDIQEYISSFSLD